MSNFEIGADDTGPLMVKLNLFISVLFSLPHSFMNIVVHDRCLRLLMPIACQLYKGRIGIYVTAASEVI